MIQRLPANDLLRPFAKNILSLTFKLLEVDNEENVLVCLWIIIELHKQFRPSHSAEITHFLQFVKSIYNKLPDKDHLNKIFDPRPAIKVKELADLNIESELTQTFTITTVQTVECIRLRSEQEGGNGKELLVKMMEVFVLKFKTVSKLHLPVLMQKHLPPPPPSPAASSHITSLAPLPSPATPGNPQTPATPATPDIKSEPGDIKPAPSPASTTAGPEKDSETEKKTKFGFPQSQASNYSVSDCRSLVKTLVCGVKTITWGLANTKNPDGSASQSKQFQPKETLIYIRLVKWAMEALDVYTINTVPGTQPRTQPQQTVRTKEEKEVLEHFAGVFALLNPLTFKEVFSQTIDYVVERIFKNYALQIMANSFLANNVTSPIFATILVEYLLDRMHEMGSNMERSNLYLKLFKLVFGSVSLFAAENEQMLKPHLHQIVNKSMELAMSAKEPYNYFLLLRALFRSIGGGSHDLLYQEFLPLLPNLLQGLNSLQSGLHKQHMKDLFVELCLTVPVRLSSLLPYLPMLMDPLVSALNGSQNLVSQGKLS